MANDADIKIGADLAPLDRALALAQSKLKSWGNNLARVGLQVQGAGAAMVGGFVAATYAFAEMGSDMKDMSDRTGIAVESLSELRHAAEQSGSSAEEFEVAIKGMSNVIAEAASGNKEATDKLDKLGLSVMDFKNLHPDEAFMLLAQKISEVDNPMQRAAIAMDIFGKAGMKMLPMLADGAEGIQRMRDEARRMGVSMSGEDANAAESLGDQISLLTKQFKYLVFHVGAAVAPIASQFLGAASEATANVIQWVKANKELLITAFKVGVGIAAFGAVVFGAGLLLLGLAKAIGIVMAVASALGVVLAFAFSPAGIAVVGLLALAAVVGVVAYKFRNELWQAVVDTATALREKFKDSEAIVLRSFDSMSMAWQGVVDSMAAGNLVGAFEIAISAVQIMWLDLCAFMEQNFGAFADKILERVNAFVERFERIRGMFPSSSTPAAAGAGGGQPGAQAGGQRGWLDSSLIAGGFLGNGGLDRAMALLDTPLIAGGMFARRQRSEQPNLEMGPDGVWIQRRQETGVSGDWGGDTASRTAEIEARRAELQRQLESQSIAAWFEARVAEVNREMPFVRPGENPLEIQQNMNAMGSFNSRGIDVGGSPIDRLLNQGERQNDILGDIEAWLEKIANEEAGGMVVV